MEIGAGATNCYWLEPTGRGRLSLRRFTFSVCAGAVDDGRHHDCPAGDSGCDATVDLDEFIKLRFRESDEGGRRSSRILESVAKSRQPGRRDPRWPQVCDWCGESFPRGAMWQVNQPQEYRRADNGELVYIRAWPGPELAGALFDCRWRSGTFGSDGVENVGPDGISLAAVCPNGMTWEVDGEATGGGRWTRTGDPRHPETLTVQPSIRAGRYHGFLQAGRFTAHIG